MVEVILTSSESCATNNPATSNSISMVVNPNLPVNVAITESVNDVCDGTSVTFNANPTNGGVSPSYDWLVNGSSVGAPDQNTFTSNTLNNGDDVEVIMTSSLACVTGNPANSNVVNMVINPILNADVTISADMTTICSGSAVTFTATPTNGGTTPSYVWFVNGVNIGAANNPIYTTSTLNDGDDVYCIMTSSETCVTNSPAMSNTVNITVNSELPVSAIISADNNPVCDGGNVTFTVTPTNGGATPSYDWLVNGSSVGAPDANTFTSNSLNNSDVVEVILTSSESCATNNPATSNSISMVVNPNLPVNVAITESVNDVCDGTSVTFNANPTNGGVSPSYDWLVNGSSVGAPDQNTFTSNTLNNGDDVEVIMTSSLACVTGNPANSNVVNMVINPILNADVTISADMTTICSGSAVTFTATPTNGGTTPSYVWFVNGVNIGAANNPIYTTSTLNDGDDVYCIMTSSETCVTNSPAMSNTVNITVNSELPVSAIISADNNPVCDGGNVTFTVTPTNGGATPSYDWLVNGSSVGAPDANTFTSNSLNNSDVVEVILTSSESCATNNPATSNSISMVVNPNLPVNVAITESVNDVCDGTSVTFNANPTNGGVSPSYDWLVNGSSVGAPDQNTFTSNTLNNGDDVEVIMTSSLACVTGNPANSNVVNMVINPILNADVTISADMTTICSGSAVTFTATPTNGGTTPSYVWFVNGVNIGAANNPIYTTSTLNDGDDVYCIMTSSETCVTNSPAMSNTVNITANPVPVVPSVDILCNGTNGAGVITVTDPIGAEYTYSIDGVVFQTETQFIDVANGTYTITIDQGGCTNVSSEVLVDCSCDNPTTLTISANSGIACSAEDFTLNGNMFGGNASEVTVTHDGAGVLDQSVFTTSPFDIVYIPDATDLNQTITFTVVTDDPAGDLCDAISEQFTITVYESPVVDLPESVNACEGEEFTYTLTETYDYVIWMDAIESNTYTANYTFSGDYQVWVWVENEYCAAQDTMTVVVTVCSDIDQALNNGRFDIYPNPTRENCQLSVSDYQGKLTYSVVDVQGKVIISKQLNVQTDYVEDINVEDFVPGMYFIRLTTRTETINFKLIKN